MKAKRKITQGIATIILLAMMTSTVFAQNQARHGHPGKSDQELNAPAPPVPPAPPEPPSFDNPGAPALPQLDLPGLTGDQKDKIYKSDMEHMKMMTPLHNQVAEKKARLQTLLTTMPFDAKAADQIAEELGKIGSNILKETISHDQELRNLLTPQQQVLFDTRPKPFLRRER